MADNLDTIMRILGHRPSSCPGPQLPPIPDDATIYNGSEPMLDSQIDGIGLHWLGWPTAVSGAYYAAVLADDPLAAEIRAHNRAVGGIVVEYITMAHVRQALADYFRHILGLRSDSWNLMVAMDDSVLWRQYVGCGMA